jgi:hypothetical protein
MKIKQIIVEKSRADSLNLNWRKTNSRAAARTAHKKKSLWKSRRVSPDVIALPNKTRKILSQSQRRSTHNVIFQRIKKAAEKTFLPTDDFSLSPKKCVGTKTN